ncbi:Zn-ribbon domain-containing OB-fold protein [Nocardia vaccinii]|uniref:Zn-ribbon domain-containing OB-fold protein n=1 Tax=Nocardia vaccinii TaxID=1822 RepID=UPI0008335DE4|nr:Zn-ribbon domain-containing OB-fold protein [Nocardia vaccinii]
MATRLAPTTNRDTEFFWDGLREHRLLIQRCTQCRTLRVPPRPMCGECTSLEWEAIESAGRGIVYSYVLPHYPPMPMFTDPHIVALIELDEGVRIVSNLCDITPDRVSVGMRVEAFYVAFNDGELVLHQFRPTD